MVRLRVTPRETHLENDSRSFRFEYPNSPAQTTKMTIVEITKVFKIFKKKPGFINQLNIWGI